MKTVKLMTLFVILTNCIFAQQPQIGVITEVTGKQVTLKLETTPTIMILAMEPRCKSKIIEA